MRTRWQIRLTLGVSTAMLFASLIHLPRVMWVGIATMSVLLPFKRDLIERVKYRAPGNILGGLCFLCLYYLLPEAVMAISVWSVESESDSLQLMDGRQYLTLSERCQLPWVPSELQEQSSPCAHKRIRFCVRTALPQYFWKRIQLDQRKSAKKLFRRINNFRAV